MFFPLKKRFYSYFEAVGSSAIYSDFRMECKARCNGIFRHSKELKAHLTDVEIWHHKLIKCFIIELYEVKPDPYYENRLIIPMKAYNRDLSKTENKD